LLISETMGDFLSVWNGGYTSRVNVTLTGKTGALAGILRERALMLRGSTKA